MGCKLHAIVIFSSFTTWKGHGEELKIRFVVNLSIQYNHWNTPRLRTENLKDFAAVVEKGEHFLSFTLYIGYLLLRLHPLIRHWFTIHYDVCYYQCVPLNIVWAMSPWWFTQVMAPFIRNIRSHGFRALGYIYDFLVVPSPMGTAVPMANCRRARPRL